MLADSEAASGDLTEVERVYGGQLRFPETPRPYVFANFVSTIDGVATLEDARGTDSMIISGKQPGDRFLMAMLRAAADVVLIGSRTLRATPRHQWTPAALVPAWGTAFDAYRAELSPGPTRALAIVSARGDLPEHAALADPALAVLVVTTPAGAERALAAAPRGRVVVVAGNGAHLSAAAILEAVARETDAARILCEGGPTLFGSLLRDRAANELFLTVSPRLAGRAGIERLGIVEGWSAPADALTGASLLSVRRSSDHLFLRYRLTV